MDVLTLYPIDNGLTAVRMNKRIIDPSHTISVKYAQETGQTELAWKQENIKLRCRACHHKHDEKTNLEREEIYNNG